MDAKYKIYKITNIINQKYYIGSTIKELKERFTVHVCHAQRTYKKNKKKTYIQQAIKKYGKENFTIHQIDTAYSKNHCSFLEYFLINYYQSNNPKYGYNILGEDPITHKSTHSDRDISQIKTERGHKRGEKYCFFDKKRRKWIVSIKKYGIFYRKRFQTEQECKTNADLLNIALYNDYSKLFYPDKIEEYKLIDLPKFLLDFQNKQVPANLYFGVSYNKLQNKYLARTFPQSNTQKYKDNRIHLGTYERGEEAALIVDKVNFYLHGELFTNFNFPELINKQSYIKEGKFIYDLAVKSNGKSITRKTSSKYLGVDKHKQSKNIWCYTITIDGVRLRGTRRTEAEAAYARDCIAFKHGRTQLNFPDRFIGIDPKTILT